jgi:hypothetical protein
MLHVNQYFSPVTTYNTIDAGLPETIHCICGGLVAKNQME